MTIPKTSLARIKRSFGFIADLPIHTRIEVINELRAALNELSPFKDEPVDFVRWVAADDVHANDYNPNSVAPKEMELLRVSIMADGYTQPIVTNEEEGRLEVVDGFHRNRVGKECEDVHRRVHGYLPVVQIKESQAGKDNRMAATIRHNRARGHHRVEAMSDIVMELKRRFWSDEKIARELGMEPDEVLRLAQITGLSTLFSDREFSEAWEADEFSDPEEIEEPIADTAQDQPIDPQPEAGLFSSLPEEEYRAGMWEELPIELREDHIKAAAALMRDPAAFEAACMRALVEWPNSSAVAMTTPSMNLRAWIGHAGSCIATGTPEHLTRQGWRLLSEDEQDAANDAAWRAIEYWRAHA